MNNNKLQNYLKSATLVAASSLWLSSAQAEISLGDRGAIAFGADAELKYDSNILLNNTEVSDTIATAQPKIYYRSGRSALFVDAFVGYEIKEYFDESEFDSENFKSGIRMEYPRDEGEHNFELVFIGGYNERTSADAVLQTIVERDEIKASLMGIYHFTERYFLRSGFEYVNSEVDTAGFRDTVYYEIPLELYYEYSDDLALGAGYQYKETDVMGGAPNADSEDHFLYFSAVGRILPSVESALKVGAQMRDFDNGNLDDEEVVYIESVFTWFWRDPSTLELRLGNEMETPISNNVIEKTYAELELDFVIDEKLSFSALAGYSENAFVLINRDDEQYYGGLKAEYELIEDRLDLTGRVSYVDQSSNVAVADFEQTIVSLGLSFIY